MPQAVDNCTCQAYRPLRPVGVEPLEKRPSCHCSRRAQWLQISRHIPEVVWKGTHSVNDGMVPVVYSIDTTMYSF